MTSLYGPGQDGGASARMSDDQLRTKLNDEFRQMGCPYRIGDERLDAWQEGYRAALRFAMGATS